MEAIILFYSSLASMYWIHLINLFQNAHGNHAAHEANRTTIQSGSMRVSVFKIQPPLEAMKKRYQDD